MIDTLQQALALHREGNLTEAEQQYRQLLSQNPQHADALHFLGVIYAQQKRHQEAIDLIKQSLLIKPDSPSAVHNLGLTLYGDGQIKEAIHYYDQAIALNPNQADAYYNRGVALDKLSLHDEALVNYTKALQLNPQSAETYNNRGTSLQALERYAEALASYEQAIALKPNFATAYYNRGLALENLQQLDLAIDSYAQATTYQADYADAYSNKSFLHLLKGEFELGWQLHEWRWRKESFASPPYPYHQPLWLGDTDLAGKTILLYSEQGLGDIIQFSRYATNLATMGASVYLCVPQELLTLLQSLHGVTGVLSTVPLNADTYCPLLSLPLACKTFQIHDIPANIPYLFAPSERITHWKNILGSATGPRVGLVWSGTSIYKVDSNRSIPLSQFVTALPKTGFQWISLHKEIKAQDREFLDNYPAISYWGDALHDMSDTAALLMNLDLVISVDTAVAHLAGALGKPVWLLNRLDTDWRWLQHRTDSPWYPTMKIYRQHSRGDWQPVLQQVNTDLQLWQDESLNTINL